MDELRKYSTLADFAKEISISQSIYDSALRSLSSITTMDMVQDILDKRDTIEKSLISSIDLSLNHISGLTDISSTLNELSLANNSINSLFDSTHRIAEDIHYVMEQQNQWREIAKNLTFTDQIAELSLRRHMSEMLSTSLAAQSNIMAIQSYTLGGSILANESIQQLFLNDLDDITKTYKSLFDVIGRHPATLAKFSPIITRHPPIELFRESKVLKEITVPQDEQLLEVESDVKVIPEETSLYDWLMELDPRLPDLLRGAHQALKSPNPDRARHAATSLRELFTHVIHFIAPDDDIKKWTLEDEYFYEGKPTRRARLLYVCRQIDFDELSDFVNADVNASLTLVDALQSGTHGIKSSLSDRQINVMIDRMESLLFFMLRLNSENT